MVLKKFIWENYLESASGKKWAAFFETLESNYLSKSPDLETFILHWMNAGRPHDRYSPADDIDEVIAELEDLRDSEVQGLINLKPNSWSEASKLYRDLSELVTEDEDEMIYSNGDIPRLSIALSCLMPKYFFPYYFFPNFHALGAIFQEFGIFLPPIPKKSDYEQRFLYYLELAESLHQFAAKLEIKPEHIPVFLYGFAPEVLDLRTPNALELPEPKRAWFVGGGVSNGDYEWLENSTSDTHTFWTGNKDTEVGDIVVMYCISPKSIVHSIWRAVQPGTLEPFRHWTQTVTLGFSEKVNPIRFDQLATDPVMSKMGLVRSKMQGINGRLISKEYYDRLLELLEANGTDVSKLPRLRNEAPSHKSIKNERDVELHVLEPLLARLGFSKTDWERQVALKVGRSEKVIPDYLISVVRNEESKSVKARWVWEAKHSIPTNDQLAKDFSQVCSYARLVGAEGVGLVSREGVWLSAFDHDLSLKDAKHYTAGQLLEVDSLNQIRAVAGASRKKR